MGESQRKPDPEFEKSWREEGSKIVKDIAKMTEYEIQLAKRLSRKAYTLSKLSKQVTCLHN